MASLLGFKWKSKQDAFNLAKQERSAWHERAEDAVLLWAENRGDWRPPDGPVRIADLGAGNERLHEVLDASLATPYTYAGYDLEPQQASTRRLDVLRELPSETFDLAFCLGVLEYLPDDNDFIERLGARCNYFLVSYVPRVSITAQELSERQALGWHSHLDRIAFENRFSRCGYGLVGTRITNAGHTGLWLWATSSS
jgi:hypothetical protein